MRDHDVDRRRAPPPRRRPRRRAARGARRRSRPRRPARGAHDDGPAHRGRPHDDDDRPGAAGRSPCGPPRPGAASGLLCGGTIRDATHVVTAAHCVFSTPLTGAGQTLPAAWIAVKAGRLAPATTTAPPPSRSVGVSAVSFLRTYGGAAASGSEFADDAALLTLAARARPRRAPSEGRCPWSLAGHRAAASAAVTGRRASGCRATRRTPPPSRSTAACAPPRCRSSPTSRAPPTAATTTRARCSARAARASTAAAATAAGPLAAAGTLAGIVSWGPDPCGAGRDARRLHEDRRRRGPRSFLGQPAPAPAPRNTGAPAVDARPAPRRRRPARARPGLWDGATSFAYQVLRTVGTTTTRRHAVDGQRTRYTRRRRRPGREPELRRHRLGRRRGRPTPSRPGRRRCRPASRRAAAAAPAVVPPAARVDRLAPTTKVSDHRCRRARCRVDVRVTGPGGQPRRCGRCRRASRRARATGAAGHGRRTTCTRQRDAHGPGVAADGDAASASS